MSEKNKNLLLIALTVLCITSFLHCYISNLFIPSQITGYNSKNFSEKSEPFLLITKRFTEFVWQSNGDKKLNHYVFKGYDPLTKKIEKKSIFVSTDGSGFIVIRHKGNSGHWEGKGSSDVSWPNIQEYKIDDKGNVNFKSGSSKPFP